MQLFLLFGSYFFDHISTYYVLPKHSCVDIAPGGLIVAEGGVLRVYLGIVKVQIPGPEDPGIADVPINAVDAKQAAVFPVGD